MKNKILLFLGLGLLTFSCKKEYTCACTQLYTEPACQDNNGEYHQPYSYYSSFSNTIRTKKNDSESTCKQSETIYSTPSFNSGQGPSTTVITCEVF